MQKKQRSRHSCDVEDARSGTWRWRLPTMAGSEQSLAMRRPRRRIGGGARADRRLGKGRGQHGCASPLLMQGETEGRNGHPACSFARIERGKGVALAGKKQDGGDPRAQCIQIRGGAASVVADPGAEVAGAADELRGGLVPTGQRRDED